MTTRRRARLQKTVSLFRRSLDPSCMLLVVALAPDDTDLTICDCDDTRMDVRPAFGSVAGAPEACDGVDNNCNARQRKTSDPCVTHALGTSIATRTRERVR